MTGGWGTPRETCGATAVLDDAHPERVSVCDRQPHNGGVHRDTRTGDIW